jgi:hypothetical protein
MKQLSKQAGFNHRPAKRGWPEQRESVGQAEEEHASEGRRAERGEVRVMGDLLNAHFFNDSHRSELS